MSRRLLLCSLAVIALAAALPAAASATPVFTLQNCFSAAAASACAPGTPLTGAVSAVPSPNGAYVYGVAVNGGLTVYARNSVTGALTRVSGTTGCYTATAVAGCTTHAALLAPFDLTFDPTDPTGAYAYVVGNTGTMEIFARNAGTGAFTAQANCLSDTVLTCVTPVVGTQVLTGARTMVFSPDGTYAYVGSSGRGTAGADDGVTRFSIVSHIPVYQGCTSDSGAGDCANGAGLAGGTDQMAISSDRKFLYTTGLNDDAVVVFSRNTGNGVLTESTCYSPTDTIECAAGPAELVRPYAVLIPPDDQTKLYVGTSTGISVFSRNTTTGALARIQCLNAGGTGGCGHAAGFSNVVPNQIALTPDGTHLALTQAGSNGGVVFLERNKATGLLSQLPGGAGCVLAIGTGGACRLFAALGGISLVHAAPNASQFYLGAGANGVIAAYRADNPPACASTLLTTPFQTAIAVPLTCADADGDAVTVHIVHAPAHGGIGAIDQTSHRIAYNPFPGFSGADAFTFQATAHSLASAVATATLSVGAAPPPPTPVITSPVETSWTFGSTTRVVRLTVKSVPVGATVKLTCKGKKHVSHKGGCTFSSKTYKEPKGKATLTLKDKFKHAKLKSGTEIRIDITAPGSIGKEVRFTIRTRKLPKLKSYCFSVGSTKPHTKCK